MTLTSKRASRSQTLWEQHYTISQSLIKRCVSLDGDPPKAQPCFPKSPPAHKSENNLKISYCFTISSTITALCDVNINTRQTVLELKETSVTLTQASKTHHWITRWLHISVKLHILFLVLFSIYYSKISYNNYLPRYNILRSLSPSRLSAMDSSSLPPPKQLSSLDANSATDTFCSTLTSCLDTCLPLVFQASPYHPFCPFQPVLSNLYN